MSVSDITDHLYFIDGFSVDIEQARHWMLIAPENLSSSMPVHSFFSKCTQIYTSIPLHDSKSRVMFELEKNVTLCFLES